MEKSNGRMTVDVIIPTYRPPREFALIVERIKKQTVNVGNVFILNTVNAKVRDNDIRRNVINFHDAKRRIKSNGILAEDGSVLTFDDDDNTHISVFNIMKEEFDHGATRDYGAALSDAEFIVMMSQNALLLDRRVIEKLLEPFSDPVIAASYARQFPSGQSDEVEKLAKRYMYPAKSRIKSGADIKHMGMQTYACSNTCAAYRKSVYNELGGFVGKTIYNEDVILAAKIINAGYKVAYTADARVRNTISYTFGQTFQRSFDLGVSVRQYRNYFKVTESGPDSIDRVKAICIYLVRHNKAYLIPKLLVREIADCVGYEAGYNYEKLPNLLVKKMSSNEDYWNK